MKYLFFLILFINILKVQSEIPAELSSYYLFPKNEMNTNEMNTKGKIAFREAMESGNLGLLKKFIKADPDIVNRDFFNEKPLTRAIRLKKTEVVKLLVENKADVNADIGESMVLNEAAFYGNPEILEVVLKYGALVNKISKEGFAPIHEAVRAAPDSKNIEVLLKHGADPNIQTGGDSSHFRIRPLYYAIITAERNKQYLNTAKPSLKILLKYGADPNLPVLIGPKKTVTALEQSMYPRIHHGGVNLEAARILVENKANVNEKDKNGSSLLMRLIMSYEGSAKKREFFNFLLKNGLKIDIKDNEGRTVFDLIQIKKDSFLDSKMSDEEKRHLIEGLDMFKNKLMSLEKQKIKHSQFYRNKAASQRRATSFRKRVRGK